MTDSTETKMPLAERREIVKRVIRDKSWDIKWACDLVAGWDREDRISLCDAASLLRDPNVQSEIARKHDIDPNAIKNIVKLASLIGECV